MRHDSGQREGKPARLRPSICPPFRYNPSHSSATHPRSGEFLA
jgi:hypothetical protein